MTYGSTVAREPLCACVSACQCLVSALSVGQLGHWQATGRRGHRWGGHYLSCTPRTFVSGQAHCRRVAPGGVDGLRQLSEVVWVTTEVNHRTLITVRLLNLMCLALLCFGKQSTYCIRTFKILYPVRGYKYGGMGVRGGKCVCVWHLLGGTGGSMGGGTSVRYVL